MEKKSYQTPGRKKLISFLSENPDCQFTPEELCQVVNGHPEMGMSSIYRHLNELCTEDIVRKFRSEERKCSVYQYVGSGCDCKSHFHQKCLVCGSIRHLDCEESAAFAKHLLEEHGFEVYCGQSMLYGICLACRKKKKEQNQ